MNTKFDTRHPILLYASHTLVRILAYSLHHKHLNQGLDYKRSVLNMKYTKLGLCRPLRSSQLILIYLSNISDNKHPPINHTGVEYFGQFYVPVRKSTEKRWGFLFTCLTARAVHLETVPSLDTSSSVMGIERFIMRRGTPRTNWSDNGTNFVGAEKELLACIKSGNGMGRIILRTEMLLGKLTHQA